MSTFVYSVPIQAALQDAKTLLISAYHRELNPEVLFDGDWILRARLNDREWVDFRFKTSDRSGAVEGLYYNCEPGARWMLDHRPEEIAKSGVRVEPEPVPVSIMGFGESGVIPVHYPEVIFTAVVLSLKRFEKTRTKF